MKHILFCILLISQSLTAQIDLTISTGGGCGSTSNQRPEKNRLGRFEKYPDSHQTKQHWESDVRSDRATPYQPQPYTPSQNIRDLTQATQYFKDQVRRRNEVREQIKSMDQYEKRSEILNYATESLKISRDYYDNDEIEEGKIAAGVADVLLDLATSLTPVVSWGRDLYEAISGKDLHSGEELGEFSRSMAVLGVVTVGFGSKIGKACKFLAKLMKGDKAADALRASERVLGSAGEVTNVRWGLWTDLPTTTVDGAEYASIGDRLYTRHAIDRMTPMGFGTAAGGSAGRGVPTVVVEHILQHGTKVTEQTLSNGIVRETWKMDTVEIVTEQSKKIVVTVMRKGL
ncbi:MAG: pre-toxin TG domain-containing protein [Oligoflexales bacterium]|nr:pre-toxin TG domain-containing protein [Oligoflexales bacterium]